uniref:General transcription factor TFIIB n=1 Tax=Percolomonas cosmopolitus TaxID=63605 RepID=A0A7S1KP31_9EUKA|mmetsp:Transcript_3591/g.13731  ORF Transcript_3591/g.13731 Transcript_3591/m.13731 type:complete len:323 (+) Transcript_3591:338-1306(+)
MHFLVSQLKKKSRQKNALSSLADPADEEARPSAAKNQFSCPQCGNTHLVHHYMDGHYSCTDCGTVTLQNIISEEQEWREFEDDDKSKTKSRAGSAINDDHIGLSTSQGKGRGKAVSRVEAELAKNNAKKEKLQKSYKKIDEFANKVKVMRTVTLRAKKLYKDLMDTNAFQGRSQKACIGAVLYYASKLEGNTLDMKLIEVVSHCSKRNLNRTYKEVKRALNVKKNAEGPSGVVQSVCDRLQLGQAVATAAKNAVEKVYHRGLAVQKTPTTIAAAVIILVLKNQDQWTAERESQIASELSISKKTVSEYLRELSIYRAALLAQ